MCGIAGFFHPQGKTAPLEVLQSMTRALAYRGPDGEGYHHQSGLGFGHRRLSIIDLSGGTQPMFNADRSVVTIFNGEIFNYIELRQELEGLGYRFASHSDTETILHGYAAWGLDVFTHLNGQFAIAIWDDKAKRLILGRDRVGIRPLFHAQAPDGALLFGSEMKALFQYPGMKAAIDPHGISQVFTFWANVPPDTVFQGVKELPPGHMLVLGPEGRKEYPYWKHRFPRAGEYADRPTEAWASDVRDLLHDATTLQLRADVPVAAYLSGGLDSSIISALVKKFHNHDLITFSVAFKDPNFDERAYQQQMVDFLGTDHRSIEVDYHDIGAAFSDVVRLSEKPMIRTAPAPLLSLAKLVRETGIKVVLTGEGSDEIFGGYSIFREDKVRRFWARQPESKWRPLLLSSLHPEAHRGGMASAFWTAFFKKDLSDTANPYYSHSIRWANTAQLKSLFTADFRASMGPEESLYGDLERYLDPEMKSWHPLCRAQYLEMSLFMSGYLLSSQGDRMMMGNSVEGRVPFLDHRLIEFAATIPPKHKIRILDEKNILKRAYQDMLPPEIVNRPKQPYRAPISQCFLSGRNPVAAQVLSSEAIRKAGYFEPTTAKKLLAKATKVAAGDGRMSERDDMAVVSMVSMQLLHHHFIGALA